MNKKPARASKQPRAAQMSAGDSEERHRQVAEAAYYIAQSRGFLAGNPERDWLDAERELDLSREQDSSRSREA